jgi:hypothetical protein
MPGRDVVRRIAVKSLLSIVTDKEGDGIGREAWQSSVGAGATKSALQDVTAPSRPARTSREESAQVCLQ